MKKILAATFLSAIFFTTLAQAQTPVLEQDVNTDTIETNWGPNKRHYKHLYIGYGLGIGTEDRSIAGEDLNDIKYGFGTNILQIGWRYKLRLAEHYALGLDLSYNRQAFSFKQRDHKGFPSPGKHEKERLTMHNAAIEIYNRINFGKRGNHLGTFADLGAYGEWNFSNTLLIEDKVDPATSNGAKRVKAKYKDLNYLNDINYGVTTRVGYGRFSVFGRYRLSDMFDDKITGEYPELHRLTVGLQIKI